MPATPPTCRRYLAEQLSVKGCKTWLYVRYPQRHRYVLPPERRGRVVSLVAAFWEMCAGSSGLGWLFKSLRIQICAPPMRPGVFASTIRFIGCLEKRPYDDASCSCWEHSNRVMAVGVFFGGPWSSAAIQIGPASLRNEVAQNRTC